MSLAQSVTGIAGKVLDKFVEDKDLKAKLQHELDMQLHNANLAQIEVNKQQAKHHSLFVSGARPAIMWVCCLGLMWSFFIGPILNWILAISGSGIPVPEIPTEGLLTLTLSLLGLGGMRSFEKSKGVARSK
tara:strand:- start:2829 stop:3221 length:393 start_codon:yes stop_codon:yes gene_type:complete